MSLFLTCRYGSADLCAHHVSLIADMVSQQTMLKCHSKRCAAEYYLQNIFRNRVRMFADDCDIQLHSLVNEAVLAFIQQVLYNLQCWAVKWPTISIKRASNHLAFKGITFAGSLMIYILGLTTDVKLNWTGISETTDLLIDTSKPLHHPRGTNLGVKRNTFTPG